MADLPQKNPLTIDVLAEDLAIANEYASWYSYGSVQSDETGRQYIPVVEYDDEGEIVATYRMRVTFEKEES